MKRGSTERGPKAVEHYGAAAPRFTATFCGKERRKDDGTKSSSSAVSEANGPRPRRGKESSLTRIQASYQVFFNMPLLWGDDPMHSGAETRYYALGQTDEGRALFVAFTMRGRRLRVVSEGQGSDRSEGQGSDRENRKGGMTSAIGVGLGSLRGQS
ncbi:MAG: BrnT family toxin [Lentisphaerae bacterium]|nr:BrnT family toxin [Lentisphaerota bacterium]